MKRESTCLIVDDDPAVLALIARTLRSFPARFVATTDPAEALAVLAREPVDVLITDLRMPGMSGVELAVKVRRDYPATLRIVLTGCGSVESAVLAINEGEVFRFLTKPWRREDLHAAVAEALEQADAQTRLAALARREAGRRALRDEIAAEFPAVFDARKKGEVYSVQDAELWRAVFGLEGSGEGADGLAAELGRLAGASPGARPRLTPRAGGQGSRAGDRPVARPEDAALAHAATEPVPRAREDEDALPPPPSGRASVGSDVPWEQEAPTPAARGVRARRIAQTVVLTAAAFGLFVLGTRWQPAAGPRSAASLAEDAMPPAPSEERAAEVPSEAPLAEPAPAVSVAVASARVSSASPPPTPTTPGAGPSRRQATRHQTSVQARPARPGRSDPEGTRRQGSGARPPRPSPDVEAARPREAPRPSGVHEGVESPGF